MEKNDVLLEKGFIPKARSGEVKVSDGCVTMKMVSEDRGSPVLIIKPWYKDYDIFDDSIHGELAGYSIGEKLMIGDSCYGTFVVLTIEQFREFVSGCQSLLEEG